MSSLLELSDVLAELVDQLHTYFEKYRVALERAEPLFELKGRRLEEIVRSLPYHQSEYAQLAREAEQLVKWLENRRAKIEGKLTKNYLQGQRAYGSRETATLVAAEPEMIEQNQLIIEATLYRQRLDEVVEAFKQMGWMMTNITKLRVAELQDVIL